MLIDSSYSEDEDADEDQRSSIQDEGKNSVLKHVIEDEGNNYFLTPPSKTVNTGQWSKDWNKKSQIEKRRK